MKYSSFGLLAISLLLVPISAVSANEEDALGRARTECYEVYQPQFAELKSGLPTQAVNDIDVSQLDVPPEFGISQSDLQQLQELLVEVNALVASQAKDGQLQLAQLNVDLTQCYVDQLAEEPTLQAKAQELLKQAQSTRAEVEAFDYTQAYVGSTEGTSQLVIPAHSDKSVRLRTYCIDGNRSIPDNQQEYFLATDASHLQDSSLCEVVKQATDLSSMTAAQSTIWANINTEPKAEPAEEKEGNQAEVKNISQDASGTGEGLVSSIPRPVAQAAAVVGGLTMLTTLVGGLVRFGSLSAGGKMGMLVVGVMSGAVSVAGIAVWYAQINQSTVPANTNQTSSAETVVSADSTNPVTNTTNIPDTLIEAQQAGMALVKAVSNGTFTSLDVTITNLGDTPLTVSTECMVFIPDIVSEEMDAQRLISDGVIGEPPPTADDPPEPEETLDVEKLKKKYEDKVNEGRDKYQEDPTEENLKDLMDDIGKCQLLGCSQDDSFEDLGETWQENIDQAASKYQQDPSNENYNALKRTIEIGQWLGADTGSAVDLLLQNPGTSQ